MQNHFTAVFKNDRMWMLKSLCVNVVLILLVGCAPQPGFHFSSSKSLTYEGHARAQSTPHTTNEPTANLPTEDVPVDRASFTTAASGKDTTFVTAMNILPMAERVKLQTRQAEKSLGTEQVKATQFHKAARKKGIGKVASERVVHTLSWLSFGLSIAGLVLLVITLSASAPLLPFALSFLSFLAAIITSRNAISRIKKNPDQFSGKGLARAGFIISLIMLLLYVAFILYILAFAGAF